MYIRTHIMLVLEWNPISNKKIEVRIRPNTGFNQRKQFVVVENIGFASAYHLDLYHIHGDADTQAIQSFHHSFD